MEELAIDKPPIRRFWLILLSTSNATEVVTINCRIGHCSVLDVRNRLDKSNNVPPPFAVSQKETSKQNKQLSVESAETDKQNQTTERRKLRRFADKDRQKPVLNNQKIK